jgi:hypothetical protein
MTAVLSPQAFKAATEYLKTEARPLERAQYMYEYFGQPVEAIVTALAAYQNPDGGFGHALEPDVRLVSSSVIATTVAFQILRQFNIHDHHPMVEAACEFLKASYDAEHRNWSNVPPFVDDAPHAHGGRTAIRCAPNSPTRAPRLSAIWCTTGAISTAT